jgi:type II secretory pathway component GspD/PulD (secretin)
MRTSLTALLGSAVIVLGFMLWGDACYGQAVAAPTGPSTAPAEAESGVTVQSVESSGKSSRSHGKGYSGMPTPEQIKEIQERMKKMGMSGMPPGMPPGMAEPPGKSPSGEGAKPVQRPSKPNMPPNPAELMVRPDEKGKVRLNFNGQPWPKLLEWLAGISKMSLDWQELPGDYLNLTTQQSYTIPEVRNMFNGHLLARGYTLLRSGERLTVAKVKNLDPSLVPRVQPSELDRRDSNEFVKTSFRLDWLAADAIIEEIKPMLSSNGTATVQITTNRIEARDSVTNLREIYALLKEEQSTDSRHNLMQTFKLHYARASEVREQLQTLLEMERKPSGRGGGASQPQNSEQAQMQAAMMAAMQQRGGGQPGGPPSGQPGQTPGATRPKAAVTLVVNERNNSILAFAPPEKMVIISEAIAVLDIPAERGQSLVGNVSRMQLYRVVGIDPELVVKTLMELGNLDPTTHFEVDKTNKAIIAYASLADHVAIRAIVAKFSGSERSFAVRRLRRLPADYVAGTVAYMMGGQPKKKKERRSYEDYIFGYGSSDSGRGSSSEGKNEFKVDADLEHNRLLLWANEIELADVDDLLVKLGEIPAKGADAGTRRVIDAGSPQEAEDLLERIRREWPSVAPNPLELPPAAPKKKEPAATPGQEKPAENPAPQPPKTAANLPGETVFRFAQLRKELIDGPREDAKAPVSAMPPSAAKLPPVRLSIDADGRIVISSEDTEALDRMEELLAELIAPRKEYKWFRLKHACAYGVALSLDEFFKDEKKSRGRSSYWSYWGDYDSGRDDTTDDDRRLSKRRKIKFISDTDTNMILVQGADPAQLKTVEELIKVFDQPPPKDSDTDRKTEPIRLQYAKAANVANAVKDVYRDLLSAKDKALAGGPEQRGRTTYIYDYYGDSSSTEKGEQKAPKFSGQLSLGVDESSNTLVLSAPAFLFDQIKRMINDLDQAAADSTVRVVKVGPGISATRLHDVLSKVLSQNGAARGSAGPRHPDQPHGRRPGGSSESHSSAGG